MIHPERDDWARQLTALRQQMAEQAASLDASGEFPWRNIDHLRAGGWLSLAVPPSCGGAGASLAQLQQVIAAIAWGEPATALIVCMQYLHHLRLAENDAWHAPLRQQVFHDAVEHGGLINSLRVEPELGSPARGGLPDTVATRRAEGWDISGHKIYTTGIEGLRWLAVWARSDDNPPLVGTWLVPGDSPGITVVKSWDHAGMRATGSHEVIFNHVRVAAEHAVDVWPADAPPAAQAEPFRLFANRQTRERMAETGGHPPRQPSHQPVVSGVGNAVIDRRQQRRLPVGEQAKRFGLGGGWRIGRPDIHRVLCRHPNVVKNNFMAAGGPHPGVIPALHHRDTRAVARHQPGTHQR
ncbi:acyl-CoA dehydrogenase family protein, partial [Klebsiella pneumoniae]|uniref:acyl-CoA dehydrogenase family protein n=1 Tax=Klebsiella pneumoniae TaxID=573 RepID=UPI0021A93034